VKRLLTTVVLATASVVVALSCLEVAARWLFPEPPRAAEEPSITVLRQPDVDTSFSGIRFRTNSLGFRGPEYASRPSGSHEGLFRIAITGDSFVMGWGVNEADTYAARLERMLNERRRDTYQVINVGLLDVNIEGAMRRLQRAIDAYAPDLIVYGATLNDIDGPRFERTYPRLRGIALAVRYGKHADSPSRLLRLLWPRWVALEQRFAPTIDYAEALHHNYFDNEAAWGEFTAGLDEFAAMAAGSGICGHVLIHTNLNALDSDHPFLDIYRRIETAASQRGLSVTVTFPYFANRRPLDVKLSIADAHPNSEGHAVLAHALYDGLLSLPNRCGLPAPTADTSAP